MIGLGTNGARGFDQRGGGFERAPIRYTAAGELKWIKRRTSFVSAGKASERMKEGNQMKKVLREAARLVVGSFAVYVVFAACSAGGNGTPELRISAEDNPRDGDAPRSRDGGLVVDRDAGRAQGSGGGGSIIDPIVDPVPAANAEPTNGSRLKAIYRVGQDGSREPIANLWWDSARGEECSWRRAADGVDRCLPTALAPGASPMFADSGCTQDAVIIPRVYCEGQPPPYASGFVVECTSAFRSRILQLGTTAPTIYNRNAEGACVDVTTTYGPTYALYRATEVPASSFVGSALEHD